MQKISRHQNLIVDMSSIDDTDDETGLDTLKQLEELGTSTPSTPTKKLLKYAPNRDKEYCGILPYFGSPIYRYEVMPMGIACAPQIWMDYIPIS